MYYEVKARFRPDTAADFLRKLTDGTIAGQEPDGREIVASMNRAVVDEQGVVRWSEKCFCPRPLQHERETVYDQHFVEIETNEVRDYVDFVGQSFMRYLHDEART